MSISHDDVKHIVEDIWSSLIGLELAAADEVNPGDLGDHLTSVVHITGEWEGSVLIDCQPGLARRAAAAMFGMEEDEPATDEVSDALGELANMAGGNVKALLPGPSQLSLPTVTRGRDFDVTVPGSTLVTSASFASGGEHVNVSVLQRKGA